jgi:hypothetical protein
MRNTVFAVALCSGCLVTDPIEFPTPTDYPPEILAAPNGPAVGDIINLTKSGYPTGYTFDVRIRDLNVEQELQAHVRLVKEPGERPSDFERLTVQRGDKAERTLQITVPTNSLLEFSCARLDLAVSGSFNRFQEGGFETIEAGSNDLAKALWWIFEGDLEAPRAAEIAASCPNEFRVGMTGAGGRGAAAP